MGASAEVLHETWLTIAKVYLSANLLAWVTVSTIYIIKINKLANYSRKFGEFTIILGGSLLTLIDYKHPKCPPDIKKAFLRLLYGYFFASALCFLPLIVFRIFFWPHLR